MIQYPGLNFVRRVFGILSMSHIIALALGVLLLILACLLPLLGIANGRTAQVLLAFGTLFLGYQVVTRWNVIPQLRALRVRDGEWELNPRETNDWVPAKHVVTIAKKHFAYADPWRPITLGFPGIEFTIKGQETPAQDLFPYGHETARDEVFEQFLKKHSHVKVVDPPTE